MLTGNKGEWSEVYALLKALSDGSLTAGDSQLNRMPNLIFPIIKVLRTESSGTFEFSYLANLVLVKNNGSEYRIPIKEFLNQAQFLLNELKGRKTTSFSVPEIEEFLASFGSSSIKAKSTVKSDIRIVLHDQRTGSDQELGFSIKSQLGSPSTLLNASGATNFVFKVKGGNLSREDICRVNKLNSNSKIMDRIDMLKSLGVVLQYDRIESPVFEGNLLMIDSGLTKVLAEMLLLFYTTKYTRTEALVREVERINPLALQMGNNHPYYPYKIKRLLSDIALGMTPSVTWTGNLDATGGFLVVKSDGDLLCYHIYNRNEFEDYLFLNTKFETPSSSRHNFGVVYEENGQLYFDLNLQIRFV